jgi:endonuclease/exonuclease/phosphatase (EEP) superfamily protein YafD
MRILRALVYFASLVFFLGMVAGYFGWVHPAFDSFSAFRFHFAVLTVISSFVLLFIRGWLGGLSFIFAAGIVLYSMVTPSVLIPANAGENTARYRLLQVNVRFNNPTPKQLLRLIASTKPDVITAQEVTPRWRDEFATIKAAYPYQLYCSAHRKIGDVAILSRRPFVDAASNYCGKGAAIAVQTIDFGGQVIEFASLHLYWPWPHQQPAQVNDMHSIFETLGLEKRPLVIAGDLNAPRWSHSAREIAKHSRTTPLEYRGASWLPSEIPHTWTKWAGLPIDNVFSSALDILNIQTQPNVGSDHLPILLEFKLDSAPTEDLKSSSVG